MATDCAHTGDVALDVPPSGPGCVECMLAGAQWLHLRRCVECGHVGCCDSSPNKHATAHFHEVAHPLVQSFEPGEEWYWCYADEIMFEVPGAGPSPSHP